VQRFTLYATGSSTAAAVATHTCLSALNLVGISWGVDYDSITDGASVSLECSALPTSELTTNDSRQIIDVVRFFGNFVTSGLGQYGQKHYQPVNVTFRPNDLVYLHATVGGTVVYRVNVTLWFK